jgi:hypothetical protein
MDIARIEFFRISRRNAEMATPRRSFANVSAWDSGAMTASRLTAPASTSASITNATPVQVPINSSRISVSLDLEFIVIPPCSEFGETTARGDVAD